MRIILLILAALMLAGCYHPVTFRAADSTATWHWPRVTNMDAASVPAYK